VKYIAFGNPCEKGYVYKNKNYISRFVLVAPVERQIKNIIKKGD
jgi:hypothetical protein